MVFLKKEEKRKKSKEEIPCMIGAFYYLKNVEAFVILTSLGLPNFIYERKNEMNSGLSTFLALHHKDINFH